MGPVSPSVLSSWVRVLLEAVKSHGGDAAALLAAAGFPPDAFRDPNARHPVREVARLWRLATEHIGDPAFGLKVPQHTSHTTFHALGYAVVASPTVADALGRVVRYCRVVTDSGMLRLDHADDKVELRVIPSLPSQDADAFRDSSLALIVHMLRRLLGDAFSLRNVTLHREQSTSFVPYERFFACPVVFGSTDTLAFDAHLLDVALPASNPELARHNDVAVREYLARLETGTIVDRTRAAIAEQATRDVSPELIARKLGMSLRSLQRSLREYGSSYEKLLSDVRREFACTYLRDGRYSVSEVAFVLGYESLSAFARAFKRWTGQPPSEYQHSVSKLGVRAE
jgi:AraC-like DNA-binding protein